MTLREAAQALVEGYRYFGCNWELVHQVKEALEVDMSPRGGKREGAGRKPAGDAATDHLHIRVSPERMAAYREAAARSGLSLTEWVQHRLDKAAGR